MCLFSDAVRVENGRLPDITWNNLRVNKTRKDFFGIENSLDLSDIISIPEESKKGLYKCRIVYDTEIRSVTFTEYNRKTINTLRVVYDDTIDYSYKYVDRSRIDALFESRGECDDIIIIKNGLVTDTSSANIVFVRNGRLFLPESYLLAGTRRAALIASGEAAVMRIGIEDINRYDGVFIINAMNNLSECSFVPTDKIIGL